MDEIYVKPQGVKVFEEVLPSNWSFENGIEASDVRSAFGYILEDNSNLGALECRDVSRAIQSTRDEADINTIVKRFGITGQLPQVMAPPSYGDFDGIFDYQTAQNVIRMADQSFAGMPADVRARFNNDPAKFVAFVDDPDNLAECRKLGLIFPEVSDGQSNSSARGVGEASGGSAGINAQGAPGAPEADSGAGAG